jgi:hypothetical protein
MQDHFEQQWTSTAINTNIYEVKPNLPQQQVGKKIIL